MSLAYEQRIRAQKLRMEIAQGKKENDAYLERVEQSKQFEQMEKRKQGTDKEVPSGSSGMQQIRRSFHQKAPANSKDTRSLGEDSQLLEKVFKKRRVD